LDWPDANCDAHANASPIADLRHSLERIAFLRIPVSIGGVSLQA
jgi:hypothetical protein